MRDEKSIRLDQDTTGRATLVLMGLPTGSTYNELDGEEAKSILAQRFKLLLDQVPYLKRHITLPRVKMSLMLRLDLYADQPTPERHEVTDEFNMIVLNDQVNVSPTPGGVPPDQARDEHGLAIPTQTKTKDLPYHYDETALEGRVVHNDAGLTIDRTGNAVIQGSTFATLDQGPAGLARGGARDALSIFKNSRER